MKPPSRRSERWYQRQLLWLFNQAISQAIGTDLQTMMQNILDITNSDTFLDFSKRFASTMLTSTNQNVYKNWREAVFKSTKSRKLYDNMQAEIHSEVENELQQLMDENVMYIKSQPEYVASRLVALANEMVQRGERPEAIKKRMLEMYPHMTASRATLIARTEASKASTGLVQVRAQKLGMNWYMWKTSKDQRVRNSHKHMENVICNYNNPPSPEALIGKKSQGNYNAGEFPNCRCYASVIVDLDLVSWPAKVYYNGAIIRMTRRQFEGVM